MSGPKPKAAAPPPPAPPVERPYPDSLCHRCAGSRTIAGRASVFILCAVLEQKYPRQPVDACTAFRPART